MSNNRSYLLCANHAYVLPQTRNSSGNHKVVIEPSSITIAAEMNQTRCSCHISLYCYISENEPAERNTICRCACAVTRRQEQHDTSTDYASHTLRKDFDPETRVLTPSTHAYPREHRRNYDTNEVRGRAVLRDS